jgi:hypothetical protein
MVNIEGEMIVNTINGRYGPFNTAVLYSAIGDFVIKYDGLDEFNGGKYNGNFVIRKTYTRIRNFGVSKIVEPIAELDSLELLDALEGAQEAPPEAIIDPIEEEVVQSSDNRPATVQEVLAPPGDADPDVSGLFGDLWPFGTVVKLDPTVGRPLLRQQTSYLKLNGYKYNAREQSWYLN